MIELIPSAMLLILCAFSFVSIPFAIYHRQWDTRLPIMIALFLSTFIGVMSSIEQLSILATMLGLVSPNFIT